MKRHFYFVSFLCLVAVIFFINFKEPDRMAAKVMEKEKRVMAILPSENNLFWEDVWESIREETEDSSFMLSEYDFSDIEEEKMLLDMAERTEADGILLCPKNTPDMEFYLRLMRLKRKDIKVVVLDAGIAPAYYHAFIGIDNYAMGEQIAQYICGHLEPGQPIILVRNNESLSVTMQKRMDGFYSVMKKNNLVSRIYTLETSSDTASGIAAIRDFLYEFDEPIYLAALGPNHTLKSAYAVAVSEMEDRVHIVGVGETEEALRHVENGTIRSLIVQDNRMLGQKSVQVMDRLLLGEMVSYDNKIDVAVITKENVQDYIKRKS